MRLLILATTKFAPTYNEKLISQINYFNSFDNMKADIFIDASLVEIEKMLSTSQYDLIYPTTVFDYSNDGSSIISFNSYLYKLLEYYNINYIFFLHFPTYLITLQMTQYNQMHNIFHHTFLYEQR